MLPRHVVHACALTTTAVLMMGSAALSGPASAQTAAADPPAQNPVDPGVRGGPAGAGGPLPHLFADPGRKAFFLAAQGVFEEVDAFVNGLGPRFNLDSCAGCHAQPAVGGTSPPVNPEFTVAPTNTVPSFVTKNGPVREARFVNNPDGTPDGGVHDLFVITGRPDAPAGCNIQQPNFAAQLAANNVIFRIPTPTFGLGLVENVPDRNLVTNLAGPPNKAALGISGRFNRTGNDGTITRFGWKAQNKSLLIFSGEAYNVEQGVTNDAFPNEREDDPHCATNPLPESTINTSLTPPSPSSGSPTVDFGEDIVDFAGFMRFLAAPTPAWSPAAAAASAPTGPSALAAAGGVTNVALTTPDSNTAAIARGMRVFVNIGCQACHSLSLQTAASDVPDLNNATFSPLSDFALHDMGTGLQDRISQGNATGREFRSAPLWGVGQRIFFLHDGRTKDIVEAIRQHASPGSEANTVISNFNMLEREDKQALVNFLRSL